MANIWGFMTPSLSVPESNNSDLPPDTTRTGVRSLRKSNLFSGKRQFAAMPYPASNRTKLKGRTRPSGRTNSGDPNGSGRLWHR
jgi:hypothetical protein